MNDPTALAPIRLTGRYHQCCSPPEHAPRRTPLVDLIDRDELDRWNAKNKAARVAYRTRAIPFADRPEDPRHGTANGYRRLGCRCSLCTEAATRTRGLARARQRGAG